MFSGLFKSLRSCLKIATIFIVINIRMSILNIWLNVINSLSNSCFTQMSVQCSLESIDEQETVYIFFCYHEQVDQESTERKHIFSNSHCMESIKNRFGYVQIYFKLNKTCLKDVIKFYEPTQLWFFQFSCAEGYLKASLTFLALYRSSTVRTNSWNVQLEFFC